MMSKTKPIRTKRSRGHGTAQRITAYLEGLGLPELRRIAQESANDYRHQKARQLIEQRLTHSTPQGEESVSGPLHEADGTVRVDLSTDLSSLSSARLIELVDSRSADRLRQQARALLDQRLVSLPPQVAIRELFALVPTSKRHKERMLAFGFLGQLFLQILNAVPFSSLRLLAAEKGKDALHQLVRKKYDESLKQVIREIEHTPDDELERMRSRDRDDFVIGLIDQEIARRALNTRQRQLVNELRSRTDEELAVLVAAPANPLQRQVCQALLKARRIKKEQEARDVAARRRKQKRRSTHGHNTPVLPSVLETRKSVQTVFDDLPWGEQKIADWWREQS